MQKISRHLQPLAIALSVIATPFTSAKAEPCSSEVLCSLGERSYHVLPPDGWDGKTTLPVLMHFHGWGRQGTVPINHKHIGGATRKAGFLLVAPNGLGKTWDFWRPNSPDTQFAQEVLKDLSKHYPVDFSTLYISGYSWGSSMAWRFACEAGDQTTVLLGISGTLYNQDETCETGPVETRHVHGLKDTVMDYPYGPNGEETGPIRLWQRTNGCSTEPTSNSKWETSQKFTRYQWDDCSSGKAITLDIHNGGHWIARGWLVEQLKQLQETKNPTKS